MKVAKGCALGIAVSLLGIVSVTSSTFGRTLASELTTSDVPPMKATPLNLYLSSEDAFEAITKNPDILFIDVRDPIEISRSGHPSHIDAIVPFRIQTSIFDLKLNEYELVDNPTFLTSMLEVLETNNRSKHDKIIITCGSGYRSALATQALAAAGFTNVWHIPDGYPGDEKPGLNTHNAWKLKGLPWSYEDVEGSSWIKLLDE